MPKKQPIFGKNALKGKNARSEANGCLKLKRIYLPKKNEIEARAGDFLKIKGEDDGVILSELSFCICAANSTAKAAWLAQQELDRNGLLFCGSAKEISKILLKSGVRFHNNKARYLVEARKKLFLGAESGECRAKEGDGGHLANKKNVGKNAEFCGAEESKIGGHLANGEKAGRHNGLDLAKEGKFYDYAAKFENEFELRNALANEVMGLGMKEASHFLRNIGNGKNIAILDRHILKNLLKYRAIKQLPATLTKKKYLEIEAKMLKFSRKTKIPMVHLDLLFWSEEAGRIFK